MRKLMQIKFVVFIGLFATYCSKDNPKIEESIRAKDDAAPKNALLTPDTPAVAGETAPKPAGITVAASEPAAKTDAAIPSDSKSAKVAEKTGELETTDLLNVRSGSSMKFAVAKVLKKGEKVKSLGKENAIWVKIGENQYVSEKFLSTAISH